AEVTWLIVQEQPETAQYLAQFKAVIGKDAKLTLFVMNAGGKLVRQEVLVKVAGEGSDFQLRGVNLLAGDSHTDLTMVLDHTVPPYRFRGERGQCGDRQGRWRVPGAHQCASGCAEDRCAHGLQHAAVVRRRRILGQAGAGDIRRRRGLRPWRDGDGNPRRPSFL